ncbi:conserved hypothetical protein [Bradyrhizobium sp. ORS 375]|uniref:hypothetical protein n=1 Tax=Bradyrhizobium sp. (strain ORS 375) TaxID=566679 RepID=UPI000240965E|nr:hypothetical protein [Bradyrhizobium sp. ORS 375]CCD92780.1 conserved hypothetical protein [Bradyrhizobium sp. ORS 375]
MQPIRKAERVGDVAMPAQPVTGVRIREIKTEDLSAVAALLTRGFAFRSEAYWLRGLGRHAARPRPAGFPAFGYCLDHEGVPVGVILLLFSTVQTSDGMTIVRANVSSWYVEPAFRAFSSMLVRAATRDKTVTYFNITPAPHTWPQVEAQGFSVYCKGQIYAALALSRPRAGVTIGEAAASVAGLSAYEADLLRQHADWGCLSLVAREADRVSPFVFQKHLVKDLLPVYRLLYCRDMADIVRFAGNIGRFLLRRGGLLVRLDANEPMEGLVGWYSDKRGRKYVKGPHTPRLGDLAFTEAALFDA